MWLALTLLLSLSLSLGYEVEPGCDDWTFDSQTNGNVCCEKCKPGNHLVSKCGSDVQALCQPCANGTYAAQPSDISCKRCTECISPLRMKNPCTAFYDTKCECVQGFKCGDDDCSFCVRCGKGEEPAEDSGCQPCPPGTFNNQTNQHCIKWSSSCPSPNQQIVSKGTVDSDIVCADLKPTTPTPHDRPTKTPQKSVSIDSYSWKTLVIVIICTCLIISFAAPLCVAMYFKGEKTVKEPPGPVEAPPAGWRLVPEPEQCSFCFPQEERGSHSSLLADDKPFELVV